MPLFNVSSSTTLYKNRAKERICTMLYPTYGAIQKILSLSIGEHELPVTENLHAALSHLRNFSLERTIWVDAICIDQKNTKEKEQQIQFMTEIYGQANRVLVWLGEAADNSDQALEQIRAAGGRAPNSLNNKTIQSAVLKLLQRHWFQRIWVLQEVAVARHVLIMCGPTEIDGYVFCLGIDLLKDFYEARAELQSLIRSVTYLIRGAIFRPNYVLSRIGEVPQAICTLGELIDMYHNHEATLLHDKRLAKFLLCEGISVETWSSKEIAVIKSKGCILGRISSVQNNISLDSRQGVDVIFKNISGQLGYWKELRARWTLQPTAKPILDGDLICILQGASKPTIIRSHKDYIEIIAIVVSPLENGHTESGHIWSSKPFARDFLLVWDWKESSKSQDLREYDALVRENDLVLEYSKTKEGDDAARIWNVIMILDDAEEYEKAEERLQEAIARFEIALGKKHLHLPEGKYRRTPLSYVVRLLFEHQAVADSGDGFGRTPLSYAAENGHEAVVKLLLEHQAMANSEDGYCRTPLWYAAGNKHKAIVKLLREHETPKCLMQ